MGRSTRQQIVEAAYDLFSRRGFHAVGVDGILARVGVTKTTMYNHFDSKESLMLAVLAWRHEIEKETLSRLMREHGGRSARGKLCALFDALDSWFRLPDFRGCIFITAAAEFPSPFEPAHQAAMAHKMALRSHLRELAEGAQASQPELLADLLSLLLEGAIILRHVNGNEDAARLAGRAAALLLQTHLPPRTVASRDGKRFAPLRNA